MPDLEAACARLHALYGMPFGAEIAYLDARPHLGHMLELYPEHPTIRAMYAQTKAAAGAPGPLIRPFVWE